MVRAGRKVGAPQGAHRPVGLKFYTGLVPSCGMENPDECKVDLTLSLTEEQARSFHKDIVEALDDMEERKFTFTVDPYFAPIAIRQLEEQIEVDV